MTITELQNRAWQTAKDKGFLDIIPPRTFGDQLMLIVSELAEALEEFRAGKRVNEIYFSGLCTCKEEDECCKYCGQIPKPEGIPVELADAVIRIGQLAESCEFDLNGVCKLKMDYNDSRPALHGGKKL